MLNIFVRVYTCVCVTFLSAFVFIGWDISSMDLGSAMERAQVLEWSLQEQLRPYMSSMKPRPSIYIPDFIAANQESRADNILTGTIAEQVMLGQIQVLPLQLLDYVFYIFPD